jgi:hypothetical protein
LALTFILEPLVALAVVRAVQVVSVGVGLLAQLRAPEMVVAAEELALSSALGVQVVMQERLL